MTHIYSNPLVHTVYYFREVFSPANPKETKELEAFFLQTHGFEDKIKFKDFAFNENINCSSFANGTLMRLNACGLMKLRHLCLYPTESTSKKIAQRIGYIFLSPLAALVDLVINVALLVFKLFAWPILRIAVRADELAKECLSKNILWNFGAVCESFNDLGWVFLENLGCIIFGPHRSIFGYWGYHFCHYKGRDIPIPIQKTRSFGREAMIREEDDYTKMSGHYKSWFREGEWEISLDPHRVRYLREHCGWKAISEEQLKDNSFRFREFKNTDIAFHHYLDFALIIKGQYEYTTGGGNYTVRHRNRFIQRLAVIIPSLFTESTKAFTLT